jgi:hypothetical protein
MSVSKLMAVVVFGLLVASSPAIAASPVCGTGNCLVALGDLECPAGVGCARADLPCPSNCVVRYHWSVAPCQLVGLQEDCLSGYCATTPVVDDCVGPGCIHRRRIGCIGPGCRSRCPHNCREPEESIGENWGQYCITP